MELPVMETWWKPDASTLKWEAWAKEEKKKTEIEKEEQREKKWKEVQKKKEIVKEEQSGKNAMGPLTMEAVGAKLWTSLADPHVTDEMRLQMIQNSTQS